MKNRMFFTNYVKLLNKLRILQLNKNTFWIILILLVACSPEKAGPSFMLNGKITGDIPDYIYLHIGNSRDSAFVNKGKFQFLGKVDNPSLATLTIPGASTIDRSFYIENTTINLFLSIEKKDYKNIPVHFITIDSIKGTKTEELYKQFVALRENSTDTNISNGYYKMLDKLVKNHKDNQFLGDALLQTAEDSLLSVNQIKNLYQRLDTARQSTYTKESLRNIIYNTKRVEIGEQMIDFSMKNSNGLITNTEAYRGKWLLIDFWASWCAPCIKQFPELKEIYTSLNSNNFEILGVSIDKQTDKWKQALVREQLPWENVIDTLGIESPILVKYNASSAVPKNYLIDPQGIVVGIDIPLKSL